jgi:prepilin-type N-terminal cleavage/methylation domain-containing protein
MRDGRGTSSKPCSRNSIERRSRRGITLIELLVALAVTGLVLGLVIPVTLSNQRVVDLDQVRTTVNQSLRAAQDLIAADVRIAGERFGEIGLFQMSPIELRQVDGASELVLRRFLIEALPVCESTALVTGQTTITVAELPGGTGSLPARCIAQTTRTDEGGGEWPPNLFGWREFLQPPRQRVAYIYQPDAAIGQWFTLQVQDASKEQVHCIAGCTWDAAAQYSLSNNSFVSLMDEFTYRLVDGVLSRVDTAPARTVRIADGIAGFDVRIRLTDGTLVDTFTATQDWTTIRSIEVSVRSEIDVRGTAVDRTMQAAYFPRNVLSR